MVVPEFPQLMSPAGGVSRRFFPCTMRRSGSGCSILMPSARSAFTVCMQSSLGKKPFKTQMPLESAAMMAARCEMLLSPGTLISASNRGARFTRNSISLCRSYLAKAERGRVALARANIIRLSRGLSSMRGLFVREIFPLGNEENFVRVRVLNFGAGRKTAYIDIPLIRSIRTRDKAGLVRNRNAVG